MALAIQPRMTLAQFEAWASAHDDRNYKFIGGNGGVLPDFRVALKDIFPPSDATPVHE